MKAITTVLLCSILATINAWDDPDEGYVPKEGLVPTKEVAIKIAVAVWEPIYGADHIADEKPYVATLDEKINVWSVKGSLPRGFTKGGVAEASISKTDGRVFNVFHSK